MLLKRFILGLAASAGFAGAVIAECTGTDLSLGWTTEQQLALSEAAAAHPFPEGRFWEVSRNGKASVLFGTIHLTDPDVADPPAELVRRVETATALLVEVTRAEEQRMQRAMILNPSLLQAPEGKRLRPLFSGREWRDLDTALRPFGLDGQKADRMSPWFLTLVLSTPPCILQSSYKGQQILDRRIEKVAVDAGVEVIGLETYKDLFRILGSGTYEDQADMLRISLPTFMQSDDLLETSKQLYLRGEIMKIWEAGAMMMRDSYSGRSTEAMLDMAQTLLLDERNRKWMDKLLPALDRGDAVVAVGALHLGGESGLLSLLEQEGFAIRRLTE